MYLNKNKLLYVFVIILFIQIIFLPSVYSNNKFKRENTIKNNDDFIVIIDSIVGPVPGEILANYTYNARYEGGIPPVAFYWDFGDSYTDTGNPVYHTYCFPGKMTVKLTGIDSKGLTDNFERPITIYNYSFNKTFMIGKIKVYDTVCNYTIINPQLILFIQKPSIFWLYYFDRNIVISETFSGFIKNNFICGYFNAGYKIEET